MNEDDARAWLEEVTTRYSVRVCPTCGAHNDAATHVSGEHVQPEDGDISICSTCANVMVFVVSESGEVGVRAPSASEKAVFDVHPEIIKVRAALTLGGGA